MQYLATFNNDDVLFSMANIFGVIISYEMKYSSNI